MAKSLRLQNMIIPSSENENEPSRGLIEGHTLTLTSSKINAIRDTTCCVREDIECEMKDSTHAERPNLADVNYENVEAIELEVQGRKGGFCYAVFSKDGFERLKEDHNLAENESMVGESVIAIYDTQCNTFIGFMPQHIKLP